MAPPCLQSRTEGRNDPDVVVMGEKAYRKELADHARLLTDVGVDILWPEYVGRIADCVAAVEACGETGLPIALGVRHIREDGSLQYGEQIEELVEALKGRRIDVILFMCSKPECVSVGLPILKKAFGGPVGAYPNIGYKPTAPLRRQGDEAPARETDFFQIGDYYPARLAAFAGEWKAMGAQIIGGCCATGPEHIQAMRPVVKG
jgi:homocysteine S-methyltransferase